MFRDFFSKIIKAVHFMHKNNFAHLDIKHENIVLDGDFHPLLCDFGMTRKLSGLLEFKSRMGSEHYYAPEML